MGCGGGYFTLSFLAGAITASCIFKFTGISVPVLLPISLAALLAVFFATITFTSHLQHLGKYLLLAGYLSFFFIGYSNMYRCNYTEEKYKTSPNTSRTILRARQFIEEKIAAAVPQPRERAVLTALITGNRDHISNHVKTAYKNSGAMHVLALSGLHIGIIYSLLNAILFFLNRTFLSRQIKLLICTASIIAYGAMTGFSPSVQRASIMIVTHKILQIGGRKKGKWDVMMLSAAIIILINPFQLIEPGFQLSYAAVCGIIAIYPTINSAAKIWENWRYAKLANTVWSLMAISVSCQIATTPFTLYYFNSLPTYFLLTNLVALPLVSLTLYLVPLTFFSNYIPLVGEWLQVLPGHILRLMNYLINLIGG